MTNRPTQEWRRSVDDYGSLAAFTFETEDDFGKALEAFNEQGGPLNAAPFDIVPVTTVFVPQDAENLWSQWLTERAIPFVSEPVSESRDLPADEVAEGRRLNYQPSL